MRYILAIAIAVCFWLYWLPAGWAVAGLLVVATFPRGVFKNDEGEQNRRGGYVKPPASPGTKAATAPPAPTSTSLSGAPSLVSAAWETPRSLRDPSRLTERGWSTSGTVVAGENGAPHLFAGSIRTPDWRITRYSDGAPAVATERPPEHVFRSFRELHGIPGPPPCGCNDTAA